ncbi:hypothetical protein [Mesorhizobium sp. SARCC-RB16n]|uniref:hypothetical protein n=1 Tax=Mesorhizobium sp. SARCC-RB16n TaxID=2116687 RepID=UPI00122EE76D|nr:hypothetical protein [Mesorhizobium sp. SARCC-RB16n]
MIVDQKQPTLAQHLLSAVPITCCRSSPDRIMPSSSFSRSTLPIAKLSDVPLENCFASFVTCLRAVTSLEVGHSVEYGRSLTGRDSY